MTSHPPSIRRAVLGIGRQQWADAWVGLKAISPLLIGSAAFGLAFGALIDVAEISPWAGASASVIVAAGASQIAMVEAMRANAPAIIAILTGILINARFALYSAALAPIWAQFPLRWKLVLSYLMTDQSAVTSLQWADRYPDPVRRRWFTLGAAFPFVGVWVVGTVVGILLGPVIPAQWQIGFIVPLMFIAVLVPGFKRPAEFVTLLASSCWGLSRLAVRPEHLGRDHRWHGWSGAGPSRPAGRQRRKMPRHDGCGAVNPWLIFIFAAIGTYLIRLSGVLLLRDEERIPIPVRRALRMVGPAAMGAIIVSSLFLDHGQVAVAWRVAPRRLGRDRRCHLEAIGGMVDAGRGARVRGVARGDVMGSPNPVENRARRSWSCQRSGCRAHERGNYEPLPFQRDA